MAPKGFRAGDVISVKMYSKMCAAAQDSFTGSYEPWGSGWVRPSGIGHRYPCFDSLPLYTLAARGEW
ncbi:hypothetical protein GCM10023176_34750 [Micromonospora coerulea]|uniref:Uncharacterized protein n=1 Tax=Micromonospora coerulea TaxID=47856 RepID=A0ABP8SPA1_9ACTN